MFGNSRERILFLALLVTCSFEQSVQNRCDSDEECKYIEECDEIKYFLSRNIEEISKMTVCGTRVDTVRSSNSKSV